MHVISESQVDFAGLTSALKAGATFVYPTETCYGIGCDATCFDAVERVFELKDRPKGKPCILLFKDIEMLKHYAVLDSFTENLLQVYWPGALTVLLPVQPKVNISPLIIPDTGKISCRISPHPFIQKLFEHFDSPLVSTSANVSGEPTIYESQKVLETFLNKEKTADIFVDAGDLPFTLPSTVIEIKNNKVQVFRQGGVRIDE